MVSVSCSSGSGGTRREWVRLCGVAVRFGVISDVHGNLPALRAAISDLGRHGVDGWLCVGDLVGYGAYPNECVETVAQLGALGVAGNHELIALGVLPGASSSERAHRSHRWTAAALSPDVATYLRERPLRLVVDDIVLAHGSLDDAEEYVHSASLAADQVTQLSRDHPGARLLLLGNTHRQLLYSERGGLQRIAHGASTKLDPSQRYVANPGSVGQPRQWEWPPRVRAAIADMERHHLIFRKIDYDHRAYRRELASLGLPYRSLHSPPPVGPAVRRRARRLIKALGVGQQ